MSYCKNLVKKLNGKFRCKRIKQEIPINYCYSCRDFKAKPVNVKPINKVSKHKKQVSEETYFKVLNRDKWCRLKDGNCDGFIELHHIVYRSEDVNLIDDPNNCIILCTYHHGLVHSNKRKYQPILKEIVERSNNG